MRGFPFAAKTLSYFSFFLTIVGCVATQGVFASDWFPINIINNTPLTFTIQRESQEFSESLRLATFDEMIDDLEKNQSTDSFQKVTSELLFDHLEVFRTRFDKDLSIAGFMRKGERVRIFINSTQVFIDSVLPSLRVQLGEHQLYSVWEAGNNLFPYALNIRITPQISRRFD